MKEEEIKRIVLQVFNTLYELQLSAIRQLLGKEDITPLPMRRRGRRRRSLVDLSLKILTEANRPMHVNEIVTKLLQEYGRLTDRDSLSSTLSKKARQGILVRQSSPATFELLPHEKEET